MEEAVAGREHRRRVDAAPAGAAARPQRLLPAGAIDCHAHLFDRFERYPLADARKYQPPLARREDWLALLARLNASRGVQVNASAYGFDNRITADFIAADPVRFKGVATIAPDIADAELRALAAAGFRAARMMDQFASGATTAMLEPLAARIAPFGWHLEINIAHAADWVALEPRLRACPVPLVFDHLGRVRGGEGVDAPGFRVVRRLLAEREDCWTKICSWYRLSDQPGPRHEDMRPLAQALLAERPERCVWGSNWPHSGWSGPMPDDVALVDELESWIPNDRVRQALFVTNAEQLYGFAPAA